MVNKFFIYFLIIAIFSTSGPGLGLVAYAQENQPVSEASWFVIVRDMIVAGGLFSGGLIGAFSSPD